MVSAARKTGTSSFSQRRCSQEISRSRFHHICIVRTSGASLCNHADHSSMRGSSFSPKRAQCTFILQSGLVVVLSYVNGRLHTMWLHYRYTCYKQKKHSYCVIHIYIYKITARRKGGWLDSTKQHPRKHCSDFLIVSHSVSSSQTLLWSLLFLLYTRI